MRTRGTARRSVVTAAMLLLGAGIAWADPPGPVTACSSDTQTGAGLNLAQALAAGGEIKFSCPAGSTIRVTGRYVLKQNTVIDGGDAVTLDGHGSVGPMLTSVQGAQVALRRITFRGFVQEPPVLPGPSPSALGVVRSTPSVLSAAGDAELDHVTIEGSEFPVRVAGTGTVKGDCAFVGNRGVLTMQVDGSAQIENSRFNEDSAGVFMRAGSVRNCSFSGEAGNALIVHLPTGPVEIRHSTFSGNHGPAISLSQRAGRNGPQTIMLRRNVFRDNDSAAITLYDVVLLALAGIPQGGSIKDLSSLPAAAFVLGYNRFVNNHGQSGGAIAANLAGTGGMVSTGDLFVGNNAAGDGGAVAVSRGALRMSHALFKANRAGGRGAALNVAPGGSASISNTLVVGNEGPNGTIAGDAVTLTNVTVADNLAAGLLLTGNQARVGNILLARNRPADCGGVPPVVFQGGGLQSDGTCPDLPVGEAFLDSFYVPGANSPALTAGDAFLCRSPAVAGVDLVFQARNNADNCALGAFERPPLRKFVPKTETHPVHANPADEFSDDDPYQPPPGTQPYATPPPSYSTSPTASTYPTATPHPEYTSAQTRPRHPPDNRTSAKEPAHPTTAPSLTNTSARTSADAKPVKRVLAAVKAEEASPIERVHVFMTTGNIADEYDIDRVNPGRFRMLVNPRQGGPERIVVDRMQWVRTGKSKPWFKTPAQESSTPFPFAAELFRNGLTRAVESRGPGSSRNVEGDFAWTNGTACEGKMLLRIDSAGLPSLLRFEGYLRSETDTIPGSFRL